MLEPRQNAGRAGTGGVEWPVEPRLRGVAIERLVALPCEARSRWKIPPRAPSEFLRSVPGVHPLVVQILANRDVTDPASVRAFLQADQVPLGDPLLMKGMPEAVERLARAVKEREPVVVYGDYDADGVTSTTLLVSCLRTLGVPVSAFVPNRYEHGYGLNAQAVEDLARQTNLLVAVDCGVSALAEITRARELGVDVVVLDHHHVPQTLPPAEAVVNPHQDGCRYPFKDLCAVGLAYRFAQALFDRLGRDPAEADQWLDLVALGTVADVVPLLGENRTLVARGLAAINRSPRPGVRAMIEAASFKRAVTAGNIGFGLAPRLNAPGRLTSAQLSLDLLAATDEATARRLALRLEEVNRERQQLTEAMRQHAAEILRARGELPKLVFVASDQFKSGIVGLVAGKLKDDYRRPSLVAEIVGEVAHGSARSIDEFHVARALAACDDLLLRHGGHAHAAGFTVARERLDELRQRLECLAAEQIPDSALDSVLLADAEVRLDRLDPSILVDLEALEPFGTANPTPTFVSRNLRVVSRATVGASGQHLKLHLRDGQQVWEAVGWNLADRAVTDVVDVAYQIERNEWNGQVTTRLKVVDFARAD